MTAIDDKYMVFRDELGAKLTDSEENGADGGRFRKYERGAIYWHPQTGANEVHGDIGAKYALLNAERGPLGYPLTDELAWGNHGIRFAHFVNGQIWWSARTGAFMVPPQIVEKYAAMEWANGIGLPLGDPVDTVGGEIRQRFERAVVIWSPQAGISVVHQPAALKRVIRVFLVRWSDVERPPGFTQEFFNRYFFSVGTGLTSPDGGAIPASIADYFAAVSDGFMQVTGFVMPWTTNPISLSTVVHSDPGPPSPWPRPGSLGSLGAIVAQTMRTVGIRNTEQLKVGDVVPDALVFVSLDVIAGGGATRTMQDVKGELQRAGQMGMWDSAWDSFLGMKVTLTSCTTQVPAAVARADSTYPSPPVGSLRWAMQSTLHHELVHALLSVDRDIYDGEWTFNTWFEVMSYSVSTDMPIFMSSYLRERCGFMTIRNMPRETRLNLSLASLETHSEAVRFQSGPIHAPETIVIENRRRFDYRVTPSPRLSNIVYAYSVDLKSRRVQSSGQRLSARVIKRNVEWGDTWGTTPGVDLLGRGEALANTLSPTGEHWWDFRNIQVESNDQVRLDAVYQPIDLIRGYQTALWENSLGERLAPNVASGAKGHVLMVGRSIPISGGRRYENVLNVHPDWNVGGAVSGNYRVPIPSAGARLYVTAALSDTAVGSDGIRLVISLRAEGILVPVADHPIALDRNIRTLAVDLFAYRGRTADITIGVHAGTSAARDWAHILEAVVVPMAPVLIDLLGAASSATWRTNSGSIGFGGAIGPQGHAIEAASIPLQDGVVYGPRLLYTHPAWRNDGFIEGSFPVTLPATPSIFRAELGFPESRTVTSNGAWFSVRFVDSLGAITNILMNQLGIPGADQLLGQIIRKPAMGAKGLWNNPLLAPAVQIPQSLQGLAGQLVLRVDAGGSATEDQVYWTMARITSD